MPQSVREQDIDIRSLANTPLSTVHDCFLDAFSNYEVPLQLSLAQLDYMFSRRGVDWQLSFGAFESDRLVGFVMNGIGNWAGISTAYDTGTGVRASRQGKGIGKKIFAETLPALKGNGIRQYLLEVIQSNTSAVALYQKMDFDTTREFVCYAATESDVSFPGNKRQHLSIREIAFEEITRGVSFWDYPPSWQNSPDSVKRKSDGFRYVGAFRKDQLIGYGIIDPESGDVPQIAVMQEYRRQGVGSAILEMMLKRCQSETLKFVNVDRADQATRQFLLARGCWETVRQYEMILQL